MAVGCWKQFGEDIFRREEKSYLFKGSSYSSNRVEAGLRPERADLFLERADLWLERTEARMRPERAEWRSPWPVCVLQYLIFLRPLPFRGYA